MKEALEVANLVLVVVTSVYVVLTFMLLRTSQKSLGVLREQLETQTRPYIVVDVFTKPGENLFRLRVRNLGGSPARQMRLALYPTFYALGQRDDEHDLSKYPAFSRPTPTFVPKAELVFYLGAAYQVFQKEHEGTMPATFSVTATYEFAGKIVEEKTFLDLRMYLNSAVDSDPTFEELAKISAALIEISKSLS